MVVFIHSFGLPSQVHPETYNYANLSAFEVYNIFRIVVSHCVAHCAVPTFFMISGYLFFTKLDVWDYEIWKFKIAKRIRTILFPYIIWVGFSILISIAGNVAKVLIKGEDIMTIVYWFSNHGWLHLLWDSNTWLEDRTNIIGQLCPFSSPNLIAFWFMRDLMVVMAFTSLIHWFIKRFGVIVIVFLYVCYITGVWIPINGFSIIATFYFTLGAYFSIDKIDFISLFYRTRHYSLFMVLTLLPFMVYYNGIETKIGNLIYPFFVSSMVVTFVNLIATIVIKQETPILKKLSEDSFFIFASHLFVLPYVKSLIYRIIGIDNTFILFIGYLLVPFVTIAICIGINLLVKKYFPKVSVVIGCR